MWQWSFRFRNSLISNLLSSSWMSLNVTYFNHGSCCEWQVAHHGDYTQSSKFNIYYKLRKSIISRMFEMDWKNMWFRDSSQRSTSLQSWKFFICVQNEIKNISCGRKWTQMPATQRPRRGPVTSRCFIYEFGIWLQDITQSSDCVSFRQVPLNFFNAGLCYPGQVGRRAEFQMGKRTFCNNLYYCPLLWFM